MIRAKPVVARLIPVLDYGGVESMFRMQADRIDRDRFNFRVVTFWKDGAAAEAIRNAGHPVDVLGVDPSIRSPAATRALWRYLRSLRPDILHASVLEANLHAAITSKAAGVPVTILEEQGSPDRGLSGRLLHGAMYRAADAVVGVSKAACRILVEREFAPAERVHLLYNAATREFFDPSPPRATSDSLRLLAVGRLEPEKNHEMLIRAFAPVAAAFPNARLRIAGTGSLRTMLDELVRELGLVSEVELLGYRSDIRDLLDGSDVFALPSRSEGFGIAAVEAMARGLPVVLSNAGGLPEIADGYGAEWVVPSDDLGGWTAALTRLADMSRSEHDQLGARARRAAFRFSEDEHIRSLQQLYGDLLARKRRTR